MYIDDIDKKKLDKCMKQVDKLVNKAIVERDRKGYRENLGYDQDRKLSDFINKIGLHISHHGRVWEYFLAKCNEI